MLRAFEKLHANPYFFRVLVETLLHDPALDVDTALERVRERIAADLGYPNTWLSPAPVQRTTARMLADGAGRPFSRRRCFRHAVGIALGEETPPAGRIQAALRRLEWLGFADTHTGDRALVDPEFAAWIRENDGSPSGR